MRRAEVVDVLAYWDRHKMHENLSDDVKAEWARGFIVRARAGHMESVVFTSEVEMDMRRAHPK